MPEILWEEVEIYKKKLFLLYTIKQLYLESKI